jgi:hypothetical protein
MRAQLIQTITEIQDYVPVNMTSDIDTVSPFLASAENMYLVKLIGSGQFADLQEAYAAAGDNAGAITDPEIKQAVLYCQKVIANLGYFLAIPVLSLSIGSSGIQINSNENTKQAFQWQVEDLKSSLLDLGFNGIEELLELLESDTDKFAQFAFSTQQAKINKLLIRSACDFSDQYNINNSRYVFQTIAYIMKRVEDQTVQRIFGIDFFQSLKGPTLTDAQQYLVDNYIKPGIVLLTVAKGIVERVIAFQDGTVGVNFRGRYENIKESLSPTGEQIATTTDQLICDGNQFLQDGIEHVLANPTDFTTYVAPEPRRRFKFKNDPRKGLFGL